MDCLKCLSTFYVIDSFNKRNVDKTFSDMAIYSSMWLYRCGFRIFICKIRQLTNTYDRSWAVEFGSSASAHISSGKFSFL